MENINYFFSNRNLAIFLLIISSISISFGGLIMRNIDFADAWQITFYRSLAFTFSIALILSYKNRSSTLSTIKKVGYAGVMGGILLMGANLFFIQAFANTSIANTLFTLSLIPFITAVLAFLFLKEKLSLRTFTIMLVALFGILIMINEGIKTGDLFGNIMAIGCAFCFSSFTIVIRKFRNIDMIPTLLISGIIIAVVSFILNSGNLNIPLQDVLLCFLWGGLLSGFVNSVFIYAARFLNDSEVWKRGDGGIVLCWTETGASIAVPDGREGFGSMLMRSAARQLDGEIERRFEPGRMVVEMHIPERD